MKDDGLHLIHILECIERVEQYVEGDRDKFLSSDLVQDAVTRKLADLSAINTANV